MNVIFTEISSTVIILNKTHPDSAQGERAITHHAGLVQISGCLRLQR
jgi:hypothetical protein